MATTDTITGLKAKVYSISGPASYATGGFAVSASADFSSILAIEPEITTRGSLPACDFEVANNVTTAGAESLGNGVIKIVTKTYDKATMGAVSGNPGGTTVQASKFAAATTTGSTHTHAIDHDHPATDSGAMIASGGAAAANAAGPALSTHTHSVDVAAFTGNSGTDGHTHDRSFEYQHSHSLSESTTDATATELTNGTDISTTTFTVTVYGFGKS